MPAIDPSKAPIALIPARGGSKGIPSKNLQRIGGTSLLARTIRAAQDSSRLGGVVVSTDDNTIAHEACEAGASVVERPPALAGDTASSESALIHTLTKLAEATPLPPAFVFLQCTSPFTTGSQIDRVLGELLASEANLAFAVTPWHGFLWNLDDHGWGRGVNHDASLPRQRRQDLTPTYLETGAIYALRTAAFLAMGNRFVPPLRPVVIEAPAPEIDSPADLALCRQLAPLLDGPGVRGSVLDHPPGGDQAG
ncbi:MULTISPECIES: cytidylyltransferase domain-containing protein [Aphanothece]|uniref:acylneuraminate cytidylyltransferase family protein n=1 Tax=Aphanothece TaxID=1121 RepID=UPI00398E71D4